MPDERQLRPSGGMTVTGDPEVTRGPRASLPRLARGSSVSRWLPEVARPHTPRLRVFGKIDHSSWQLSRGDVFQRDLLQDCPLIRTEGYPHALQRRAAPQ